MVCFKVFLGFQKVVPHKTTFLFSLIFPANGSIFKNALEIKGESRNSFQDKFTNKAFERLKRVRSELLLVHRVSNPTAYVPHSITPDVHMTMHITTLIQAA